MLGKEYDREGIIIIYIGITLNRGTSSLISPVTSYIDFEFFF